jgi:hypothetical protein
MSRAFTCRPSHAEDRLRSRAMSNKTYGGQAKIAQIIFLPVLQFQPNSVTQPKPLTHLFVISGIRRAVNKICVLLGCYAAQNGSPLPTFRDNVSVPHSSNLRRIPKYHIHRMTLTINCDFKLSCPAQSMTTKFLTRDIEIKF